jgi:hypothetical protein
MPGIKLLLVKISHAILEVPFYCRSIFSGFFVYLPPMYVQANISIVSRLQT